MVIYLPFCFQGVLMAVDEFYFHEKRGLPLWERIGHPLDTLITLFALLLPLTLEFTSSSEKIFIGLSVLSSLFITKDEFVHRDLCTKEELYLHALLFVLHPVILVCTYSIWVSDPSHIFLVIQPIVLGVFLVYQTLRWNLYDKLFKN